MNKAEYQQRQSFERLDRNLLEQRLAALEGYLAAPETIFEITPLPRSVEVTCRICSKGASGYRLFESPSGSQLGIERAAEYLKQSGCPHTWALTVAGEAESISGGYEGPALLIQPQAETPRTNA